MNSERIIILKKGIKHEESLARWNEQERIKTRATRVEAWKNSHVKRRKRPR